MKKVILSLAIAGLSISCDCYGTRRNDLAMIGNGRMSSNILQGEVQLREVRKALLRDISPLECFKLYVGAKIDQKKEMMLPVWKKVKVVASITFLSVAASATTAFICYNFPNVPVAAVKFSGNLAQFVATQFFKLGSGLCKFGYNFAKTKLGF